MDFLKLNFPLNFDSSQQTFKIQLTASFYWTDLLKCSMITWQQQDNIFGVNIDWWLLIKILINTIIIVNKM